MRLAGEQRRAFVRAAHEYAVWVAFFVLLVVTGRQIGLRVFAPVPSRRVMPQSCTLRLPHQVDPTSLRLRASSASEADLSGVAWARADGTPGQFHVTVSGEAQAAGETVVIEAWPFETIRLPIDHFQGILVVDLVPSPETER